VLPGVRMNLPLTPHVLRLEMMALFADVGIACG